MEMETGGAISRGLKKRNTMSTRDKGEGVVVNREGL